VELSHYRCQSRLSILSVNQAINQEFGLQLAEGQEHIETDARAIEASACSGVFEVMYRSRVSYYDESALQS